MYTSTDSGVSRTPRESNRSWYAVASSADGSKLVAVVNYGQIYTSLPSNTPGAGGYLVGGQDSAVELQYVGSGQFLPHNCIGNISAY